MENTPVKDHAGLNRHCGDRLAASIRRDIIKTHSAFGAKEFLIALGYKAEIAKGCLVNFCDLNNYLPIDLTSGKTVIHNGNQPDWSIHPENIGLDGQKHISFARLGFNWY
jgi:hypothetical protein